MSTGFASADFEAIGYAPGSFEAVDRAIEARAEQSFTFLERLVAADSTVGNESAAQEIVAGELDRLGFAVSRLPVPPATAAAAPGGVAQASYAGRYNVLGRVNPASAGPSLLLNGHIDVVPAQARAWSGDPFRPRTASGWMAGRGTGDMKGGFAMGLLAVEALRAAMPGAVTGELSFLSVIEEECTGNGTLAACQAGVLGDAVVLLEPTGLDLLLGGVGILWVDIGIEGMPAHAESADRAVNPVRFVPAILRALDGLATEMHAGAADPAFSEVASPYNVNVGTVEAGDWPSSVPAGTRLGVRVGYPRAWTPQEALGRVAAAVRSAAARDPWLAEHPPAVRESGYRAEGYLLSPEHPLVTAVSDAHEWAHGTAPRRLVMGSTTDARYYLNQFARPALAYGPRAHAIHAADEAVELASIVAGARTLARFLARYFAAGGLPGEPGVPRRAPIPDPEA
ncbi:MAG TPA: M20/M25/M40 family metallo-hydrolase [Streptosporangiaceae bacterium]|nr:M20/M25/M40 family metallo-hydrolase [Streptosporangiaceae bacterium]